MDSVYILVKDLPDELKEQFKNQDVISLEDLIDKFYNINDEFKKFKDEVADNYRPILRNNKEYGE